MLASIFLILLFCGAVFLFDHVHNVGFAVATDQLGIISLALLISVFVVPMIVKLIVFYTNNSKQDK